MKNGLCNLERGRESEAPNSFEKLHFDAWRALDNVGLCCAILIGDLFFIYKKSSPGQTEQCSWGCKTEACKLPLAFIFPFAELYSDMGRNTIQCWSLCLEGIISKLWSYLNDSNWEGAMPQWENEADWK